MGPGCANLVGTGCRGLAHTTLTEEERHKGPEQGGVGVAVDVPSLFLLFFGKGVPYALFSKGLMTCSDPLLTLHHSQGSRTRFCFLSLFNS